MSGRSFLCDLWFSQTLRHKNCIYINLYRVESKNDFLASSPIKRALRMCYSEPLYEERKKQLNSTTNVSISEEISSGLMRDLMISLLRLKHL